MNLNQFCNVDIPFRVSQEKIKELRKELDEKFLALQEAQAFLQLKRDALKSRCKHPNRYSKCHYDGSTSSNCSDCGWSN